MELSLPTPENPLKIGTRGSALAVAQAHATKNALIAAHSLLSDAVEIVRIQTRGDRILERPLSEFGGKGLFVTEIETALLESKIDIAVHSLKDMPVEQPSGLIIDTVLKREDPRDAFLSKRYKNLMDLPEGAIFGTSSTRRKAQLKHVRPDLKIVEFRGNVGTRLQKLADGVADATFLAQAGLNRLSCSDVASQPVDPELILPAPAQGIIAIERRSSDVNMQLLLAPLDDKKTGLMARSERTFLGILEGSCTTPIAALCTLSENQLTLEGELLSPDGRISLKDKLSGPHNQAAEIGKNLGRILLEKKGLSWQAWLSS